MATVLITGGTGMIGQALTKALIEKGYDIIILTRKPPGAGYVMRDTGSGIAYPESRIQFAKWDIKTRTIDEDAIKKADHIIHLAGAGVADQLWTKDRKKEIVDSRVKSGKLITEVLKRIPNQVKILVSASGIGWYGRDPVIPNPQPFKEEDPAVKDFLGETCRQWEESFSSLEGSGIKLVWLRTGLVLSNQGGALIEFLKPLRFGLATILGSGRQMISWIHIDDLVRMYIVAIEGPNINGVYNAVAPGPVSNEVFVKKLARIKRKNAYTTVRIPRFILKLVLGEMSIEVLKSTTVSPSRIQHTGFEFRFRTVEEAFRDIFSPQNSG